MKVAVVGCGNRGHEAYAKELKRYDDVDIVSALDWDQTKLDKVKKEFNIDDEYIFKDEEEFFKKLEKEKFADTIIIATYDREHYDITMKALDMNLNILLEKPISPIREEVLNIANKAKDYEKVFMICHVLRYSPFFRKIKELIDEGAIGELININHNENIGYFHFAHSFVRGNWRNSVESSPLILQKSCHDMDILLYLTGKMPKSISAYGSLTYFKEENQPEGAADRCLNCKYQDSCIFSVKDFYTEGRGRGWRAVVDPKVTDESLKKALEEGPYGRCVYKSDNDVCDHQSIAIQFEDEVSATFNLSAFAKDVHRNIKIQGTKGEIIADDLTQEIRVNVFGKDEDRLIKVNNMVGGHGGSDRAIIKAFYDACNGSIDEVKTGAMESLASHLMCFDAEESRIDGKMVEYNNY
ncbi:MAG: Gfo/Idh/MocA family oxidoreductase [Anaerococcus prevotii]|nr:Gfo/Idh/MocA family oxidoreductase [Anaerococcus prevotii]